MKNFVPKLSILGICTLFLVQGVFSKEQKPNPLFEKQRQLQEEIQNIQQEISQADLQLKKTDSIIEVEELRFEKMQKRNAKDLTRRNQELSELKKKIAEVQNLVASENLKKRKSLNQKEELLARQSAMQNILIKMCEKLDTAISQSLPWNQEKRLDRIRVLKRDLQNKSADNREAFVRLRSLLSEEIRFGDEIVLSTRPVTRNDGEIINAEVLRIGNQWMVYMGTEKQKYGILNHQKNSEKFTWNEKLSFQEREAVRSAIDVKAARKPPQQVLLPFRLGSKASMKGGQK